MTELCIDFGGSAVKIGMLDAGVVRASTEFATSGTAADLASAVVAAQELMSSAAVRPFARTDRRPTAAGIALPGVVDRRAGQLVRAHGKYAYFGGLDLKAWCYQELGLDAVVENDARAALVGETHVFGTADEPGSAPGETDAVIMTLGTGIGTAAQVDGRLLRGPHDHAGILGGHVTIDLSADLCPCGNVGCAESLASTWAIAKALENHPAREESPLFKSVRQASRIGLKGVLEAAASEDALAVELLGRFIQVWGATVVSLCHAYDPAAVIVSGGVLRSSEQILPELESYVHAHLWTSSFRPRFVTPRVPELSVLRGLSALARESTTAGSAFSDQR